ncbi:ABC transporter ATP-binding protein [Leptospira ognonensis]|uniref:ABC transporter ATP-binding protein n=1 Tax=Leptospira ognonensis TaxID=2484945 RepID=A0A4R9JY39_9LEPT|nr:ABC transporter ATP-binding protein [Leptospira ognonensis]TGL58137.1 ABC transporter ATP-binding protein [Leptospira ognonensis]
MLNIISLVVEQDTTSFLRIEHVFKSFQNRIALNEINLEISSMAIIGLLGPNGAGKTTLLKVIAGLLRPDSGFVFLARTRIGFCSQTPIFWRNLTVKEQLLFNADLFEVPRLDANKRVDFLLEELGLSDHASKLTEQLSGGMQKRVNLAISLIHRPELLLLDEPTANLDLESKHFVRNLLLKLNEKENLTIICSSHDLDEIASISKEVIFMNEGRILLRNPISASNDEKYLQIKSQYEKIMSMKVEV